MTNEDHNQNTEDYRQYPHLEVYDEYSILIGQADTERAFWREGTQQEGAKARYQEVTRRLEDGFLDEKIEEARSTDGASAYEDRLQDEHREALREVVQSVTAQQGRALVDILILQLTIKAIAPDQDVRVHKASNNSSSFSWEEGMSMRSIDTAFIGPALRRYDLLRMNRDGAFMTRSFAENYPFTLFYKAEIRGSKRRWLQIIDSLEAGELEAEPALIFALNLLWQHSDHFKALVQETREKLRAWISERSPMSIASASDLITRHIENSESRARLLEVSAHALLQAVEDAGSDLGGELKPLMPMRTANLKHGNIGDIEILLGDKVVEAWDAKYDNPYLSDSLEELRSKIEGREVSELIFGYVLMPERKDYPEDRRKINELREEFGIDVHVCSLEEWTRQQSSRDGLTEEELAPLWLTAYVESLGQQRRERAPIDEPTYHWIQTLCDVLPG